jgi:hypothetical protein
MDSAGTGPRTSFRRARQAAFDGALAVSSGPERDPLGSAAEVVIPLDSQTAPEPFATGN